MNRLWAFKISANIHRNTQHILKQYTYRAQLAVFRLPQQPLPGIGFHLFVEYLGSLVSLIVLPHRSVMMVQVRELEQGRRVRDLHNALK